MKKVALGIASGSFLVGYPNQIAFSEHIGASSFIGTGPVCRFRGVELFYSPLHASQIRDRSTLPQIIAWHKCRFGDHRLSAQRLRCRSVPGVRYATPEHRYRPRGNPKRSSRRLLDRCATPSGLFVRGGNVPGVSCATPGFVVERLRREEPR